MCSVVLSENVCVDLYSVYVFVCLTLVYICVIIIYKLCMCDNNRRANVRKEWPPSGLNSRIGERGLDGAKGHRDNQMST